jgi:hypothetical protein
MFDSDPVLKQAIIDLNNGYNQEYFTGPDGFPGAENSVLLPILERAGIHKTNPAVVYATIKTGRMVTEANVKLLSRGDKREWTKYVNEYYKRAPKQ